MQVPVPTKRVIVRVFSPDGSRVVIGESAAALQLHVEMGCSMTTKPQRNAGTVRILNLSASNRNALSKAANTDVGLYNATPSTGFAFGESLQAVGTIVQRTLETGHAYCQIDAGENDNVGRVFEGSVESLRSRQSGPDWVTEIQIADGQATAGVEIDRSWPAGTTLLAVIQQIIAAMGVEPGNLTIDQLRSSVGANVRSQFLRPFTIKRSADAILTEIFTLSGAEWWIDRGAFYVVRKGQPLVDRTLVLTNQAGGLRTAPEQLDQGAIQITADFQRGLRTGRKTVIELGGVRTEYRAEQVVHALSSGEGDFGSGAILRLIRKAAR